MSSKNRAVEIGETFRRLGATGTVWKVEFVYQDEAGIPHARVHDIRQTGDRRTLAQSVLLDRNQYEPLGRDGA